MFLPSVSGLLWRCQNAIPAFVHQVLGERQQKRLRQSLLSEAVAQSRPRPEVSL